MTDSQWLERLAVQAPQDFSEDEIADLRRRLSHSSELRLALAAQLQTDQMLAHALRQANFSAEEIVDRAGRTSRRVNRGTLVWLALAACILLLTGIGGWLLRERLLRGPRDVEVVAAPTTRANDSPTAVVDNPPPDEGKTSRIEIEAESFARGNVAIDRDKLGKGIGVIHSANKDAPAFAEYDVDVPKALVYAIEIRAACYGVHPFAILVNGKVLTELAGSWNSGGTAPDSQVWNTEGTVALNKGKNVIRFETRIQAGQPHAGFPEIDKFALSETDEPETAKLVVAEPKKPWEEDRQLAGPARPFEQTAFEAAGPTDEAIAGSELTRWFKGITAKDGDWRLPAAHFDGTGTLPVAWPEDGALRMSIALFNKCLLCFWHGDRGVGLRYYTTDFQQWAAYSIERKRPPGAKPAPNLPGTNITVTGLLATDDDRTWRLNPVEPAQFDFRCQQGRLVVSRGDIELLSAAFDGLPDQVQLEGSDKSTDNSRIGAISLIHSPGLPAVPTVKRTTLLAIAKPAEMTWTGDLPKGSEFQKLDDGSVELRVAKINQRAWQGFKLPKQGLCELVVELDDMQPGTRFYLGDDQCRPVQTIGYVREKITGELAISYMTPEDPHIEAHDFNIDWAVVPVVPAHHWLRLVAGCGTLKFWTSLDGVRWSRINDPAQRVDGEFPYTSIGLTCVAPNLPQKIRLCRVELRQLDTLKSLAPDDLYRQAVSPSAANYKDWLEAANKQKLNEPDRGRLMYKEWLGVVDKQKPATADAAAWRRACALRTLAAATNRPLGTQLLDLLYDDALAGAIGSDRMLDLLDDIAIMSDTWHDQPGIKHLLERYERFATKLYRDGQTTRPFTLVANRMFNAPITSLYRMTRNDGPTFVANRLIPESLYQPELYELVYAQKWDELRTLVEQLQLLIRSDPQLKVIEARLGHSPIQIVRVVHGDPNHPDAVRVDRRHPLVEEFNKDEYNILTEFEGAIGSKGYRDACKMVSDLAANELQGVLPNSTDSNWLLSLSTALGLALRENPNLHQTMINDFGALAALRFKAANSESDAVAMRAVSVQFQGTPAAGDAELWLGDRALAGGDFLDAREQYRRAERDGSNASSLTLAMRQRLTAAFLGLKEGQPVTAPVDLGPKHLSPAEFEAIVAELQQRGANRATTEAIQGKFCEAAPAPAAFSAQAKLKLAGAVGTSPQSIPAPLQALAGIDWAGRQMALTLDGNTLYASNRFQVWAIDASSGGQKWTVAAGNNLDPKRKQQKGDDGSPNTFDWPQAPMRPLPVGDRVFVRRLIKPSPELACLNVADGNLIWRTARGLIVASDPVMVQDQLFVLTVARHEDMYTLNLAAIDAGTGNLLTERKLADVRDSWWDQRTCQLAPMGNNLVAVCGAAVIACDFSGRLRWIRKQEWFADPEDHGRWMAQRHQSALVAGETLFATQPGVRAIECMETGSGKIKWRKVLPTIRGIVDLVDNRLIAETDEGLVALDAETGKLAWHHDASDLLDAKLAGGPGKLIYLRRERDAKDAKKSHPLMVWLDLATGKPLAQSPVDGLESENVEVGPVAVHGGRIWALVGKNEKDPLRELFDMAPTGQPAQMLPVARDAAKLEAVSGL